MNMTPPDHENKPNTLGAVLIDKRETRADGPVLVTKPGIQLTRQLRSRLESLLEKCSNAGSDAVVLTVMSNADQRLNPFAGLEPAPDLDGTTAESLVALLGPGRTHQLSLWPDHLALLSGPALEILAQPGVTVSNAVSRLQSAGGRIMVGDSLFLHDHERDLFQFKMRRPHEPRRPAAWASLSQRLDDWLRNASGLASDKAIAAYAAGALPVTLHVTHSWGGGVAQWVESFIGADDESINLQLRSEGPQTGEGCGQRFSLYLGNRLETPVARWWLQPPLQSTAEQQSAYGKIWQELVGRHGIGRVIVSSLVGHSLEVLSSGRPTLQVLHDFYPAWPLLGVHPGPYLEDGAEHALELALQKNRLLPELGDHDAAGWRRLGYLWRERVQQQGVKLAAPSRSVAEMLPRLDPGWASSRIEIIPHGLAPFDDDRKPEPKEREDGRLRLVIPGRIQPGKGKQLLLDALPALTEYAKVYLLGAGKDGEDFFGFSGVDVIPQFERTELPALLCSIGPHLAGLLSVVPETFSYTLSEMQHMNVPVIGTRVGSLAERIVEGETGWLIEPSPDALVEQVRTLAEKREAIDALRQNLLQHERHGPDLMVNAYGQYCPPIPPQSGVVRPASIGDANASAQAARNIELRSRIEAFEMQILELQDLVERRTAWAEDRERARKHELDVRVRWVENLEGQLARRSAEFYALRTEMKKHADAYERTISSMDGMLQRLQTEHDWVLASWSWRLTKPFRISQRVLKNMHQAQAWNPLRWPLLISQVSRTLRTRGLKGAMLRAQKDQGLAFIPETVESIEVETIECPEPPASMPRPEQPRASIVIPVFNNWAYTAACLRSLVETRCETSFEVIVVDDHSSDQTAERLDRIEGLKVIHNEENLGFIGSCNRGADAARGEYIVMLNNDTQVVDGWLDALLETFEQFPDTGLAGARLIYGDGRLQEAGGIIYNDGGGWNYGRLDDADRPEYQFTREVDYCSGACIALPAELFRELDGFDTRYSPAYYEDTDLAFRVREKGLKVRMQAAATIVHHEGVTSGTDINSGTKRYQAINREKFLERWKDVLADHSPPIIDHRDRSEIRRARDYRLKGNVLVIDAYTPEPNQDSGSLRLVYLMDCFLKLGYGVTFMPDNRAFAGHYTTDLQKRGVEVIYTPWLPSLQKFFSQRGSEFDFVMVSRHYVASRYTRLIRKHCPQARFIFDTVDLHYLREERQAELENSLPLQRAAAQTKRSELGVINAADATLVVSPVEKTVLAEAAPDARVHVISNVHKVVGSRKPFAERKDLFFVGGYQHPPNIDAAQWFVKKIWPLVRAELPDAQFHLIGSKATESVRALHGNGVLFHGFVESLEPWLDDCRLAVAPLRYGAGIKGKVNISMSRGQPVVATPCAVEGMFAEPGRDILVAESAEDFAREVVRLYRDEELWNLVSASGLENVNRYFSVDTARLGLQELLKSL
jgi:GT2 family glycosyltransferase